MYRPDPWAAHEERVGHRQRGRAGAQNAKQRAGAWGRVLDCSSRARKANLEASTVAQRTQVGYCIGFIEEEIRAEDRGTVSRHEKKNKYCLHSTLNLCISLLFFTAEERRKENTIKQQPPTGVLLIFLLLDLLDLLKTTITNTMKFYHNHNLL